ncbi:MAG: class I SAM-dependent methyltransferase [Chthonomonas sp.]|nr:class I SAM-dependent methyltransferase [Chthonomonas sp.]
MESPQFSFGSAAVAARYDETAPRLVPGYQEVLAAIPSLFPSATRLLVVGCGTGREIDVLRGEGRRIVGVDPAQAMLDVARERFGGDRSVQLLWGEVDNLAPDDEFDGATCLLVGHFLADKVRLWRSIRRHLATGSVLMTADFCSDDVPADRDAWIHMLTENGLPPAFIENERQVFDQKFNISSCAAYLEGLTEAGFDEVTVLARHHWTTVVTARVS